MPCCSSRSRSSCTCSRTGVGRWDGCIKCGIDVRTSGHVHCVDGTCECSTAHADGSEGLRHAERVLLARAGHLEPETHLYSSSVFGCVRVCGQQQALAHWLSAQQAACEVLSML